MYAGSSPEEQCCRSDGTRAELEKVASEALPFLSPMMFALFAPALIHRASSPTILETLFKLDVH